MNLNGPVQEFCQRVRDWPQRRAGMAIAVRHIKQRDLPPSCFAGGAPATRACDLCALKMSRAEHGSLSESHSAAWLLARDIILLAGSAPMAAMCVTYQTHPCTAVRFLHLHLLV